MQFLTSDLIQSLSHTMSGYVKSSSMKLIPIDDMDAFDKIDTYVAVHMTNFKNYKDGIEALKNKGAEVIVHDALRGRNYSYKVVAKFARWLTLSY